MECSVNQPYPLIKVERQNKEYAYLLLNDYAGIVSELSSIVQYSYQHFLKFNVNAEVAQTLAAIAKVEMHHLELLGKTIKLLGIEPKFIYAEDKELKFWNSSFVDYKPDIVEMLENDILIEEQAIKNYQKDLTLIKDKYIIELLKRIILDEEKHIECFTILLHKVS